MQPIRFPSQSDSPSALILLFHGVGSSPRSMRALGEYLHQQNPDWAITAICAPYPSPLNPGKGFHWFDITDITEASRMGRVNKALPVFDQQIRDEADSAAVSLDKIVLVGFSQGTIMSLEWFKQSHDCVAGIVGIAGRFAELPEQKPVCDIPVCVIHGEEDQISDPVHAKQSYSTLSELGIDTELHLLPDTPHRVTEKMHPLVLDFIQDIL